MLGLLGAGFGSLASAKSVFNPGQTPRAGDALGGTWEGADILDQMLRGYMSSARDAALEDREFTAAREDSAIQRRVEDIKKAGLNPYLAISSGLGVAASSASQVGAQTNAAMQMANSAAQVLATYSSLPSKNFNQLANGINRIIKSVMPT